MSILLLAKCRWKFERSANYRGFGPGGGPSGSNHRRLPGMAPIAGDCLTTWAVQRRLATGDFYQLPGSAAGCLGTLAVIAGDHLP